MKIIITESQLKRLKTMSKNLINEQDDDWIYNWFKNVPEEKISNTFSKIDFDNEKKSSFTRQEILDILSKSEIVRVPKEFFDKNIKGTLAFYIEPNKEIFNKQLYLFKTAESKLLKNKDNEDPDKIKFLQNRVQFLEFILNNLGKIVIPEDAEERFKKSGMSLQGVLSHEKLHNLYNMTKESAKSLIKQICSNSNSNCSKNYGEETEIYAYLFSIRNKFNLTPVDVIDTVDFNKGAEKSVVTINLTREGKKYTIKDEINTTSPLVKSMECCMGEFGSSLKNLHNTLAKSKKQISSNIA